MRLERCPKCNAKIAPSDTQCLDCGEDLLKHLKDLREAATTKRELTAKERIERAQAAARAAARGRAFGVERSEETRMRTFDKHEAERVRNEMLTAWATVGIALILHLIAFKLGINQFKEGGVEGLREVSMAQVREWGFGMAVQPSVQTLIYMGIALGLFLCLVGQIWRAIRAHHSIAAVARGEKPELVYLHAATRAGLIVVSVACPPAGIVFGLMMKILGRDEDTKSLGGSMLIAAIIVLVILGMNMLWGLAGNLKSPADDQRAPAEADEAARLLLDRAVAYLRTAC